MSKTPASKADDRDASDFDFDFGLGLGFGFGFCFVAVSAGFASKKSKKSPVEDESLAAMRREGKENGKFCIRFFHEAHKHDMN
jgi:hypothetical protein